MVLENSRRPRRRCFRPASRTCVSYPLPLILPPFRDTLPGWMTRPAPSSSRARLDLLDPLEVSRLGGIELVTEGVVEGFLSGLHRSPRRGFSVEFAEHRMYQPGDELRYVDWKILGRNDRLYVKQFEEETNLRAMVVCDISRSMAWTGSPETVLTKLAYAQRLIAALSLVLLRQRDATGLITFDDEVRVVLPPRARLSHWRQLVQHPGSARGGERDGRGAGAEASGEPASPPRTRGFRLRPPARSDARAQGASLPSPSRTPGSGPPPHGSRRADARGTCRGALRGPRDAGSGRSPPAGLGRRVSSRRSEDVVGEWRLACRRHGIGYHRVTTDTPFGHRAAGSARGPAGGAMIGFLHPWALARPACARRFRSSCTCLHGGSRPRSSFPRCAISSTPPGAPAAAQAAELLLLLAVRTLLIIVLALAAAGPTMRVTGVPGHAPSALVLIVDNSPEQRGGRGRLRPTRPSRFGWRGRCSTAPRRMTRSGSSPPTACRSRGDAGTPHRATPRPQGLLASARPRRGAHAWRARSSRRSPAPGRDRVAVRTCRPARCSPADVTTPLLVGRPADPPPPNVGLAQLETGTQPWSSEGGRVRVSLTGDSGGRRAGHHPIGRRPPRPGARPHRRRGGTRHLRRRGAAGGRWKRTWDPTNSGWTTAGSASCGWRRWRGRPGIPAAAISPPPARCSRRIAG